VNNAYSLFLVLTFMPPFTTKIREKPRISTSVRFITYFQQDLWVVTTVVSSSSVVASLHSVDTVHLANRAVRAALVLLEKSNNLK
jgi:hypothetical protein